MAGTILFTGANSSLGVPAAQHLLSTYPEYTVIFTVRNASESDTNTTNLRSVIFRFPNAKATVHALDLSNLSAVHAFADRIASDISNGKYPPLAAIVANAYYWNLLKGPEITSDGFDKTLEVAHIAHSALVLRLVGSFGEKGRVVLLSSDSHHPGKNVQETYPPVIPSNLDDLINPTCDADKKGRGYQRYATTKLAITTWMYPLNRYLQKDASLSKISAVAINPGKLADSRCMTTNTPIDMHLLQKWLLLPLLPLFKLAMGPTLRTAASAAIDVVALAVDPQYADKRGFYTMLQEDESAPQSRNEAIQESLWKKTLEWARITPENTSLKAGL